MPLAIIKGTYSPALALHFRNRCKLDEKEVVALEAHLHWFLGCDPSRFKENAYQHFFSGDREELLMMVCLVLTETRTPVNKLGKAQ